MTWFWIKKRRSGRGEEEDGRNTNGGRINTNNRLSSKLFVILTIAITIFLHLTIAAADDNETNTEPPNTNTTLNATDEDTGGSEGGGSTGGGGGNSNSSAYTPYFDLTNFVAGVNDWDFTGAWAKYDLSTLQDDARPLPLVPDSEDQGVFICQTSAIPSTLQKTFPPLHNASFSLTYFAKTPDGHLTMTGEVLGVEGGNSSLFNYSVGEEGKEEETGEGVWRNRTFPLPTLAAQGSFKIRVVVQHSESGVWAAAEIKIEGMTGPPVTPSPVNVTTPAPSIPTPTNATEGGETEGQTQEEDLSRLESVAQAVWDAFYVFLALFCACLVALVALIVHGRCKDDDPPPAVATYNPRTASYRMDKVYDNPSYDNNPV